jgi:hypothetical protein
MVPQTKIIEVGVCVGFTSQAHFTTVFRRYVGITPHRWRLSQTPEGSPRPANIHSTRTDAQSSQPHNTTQHNTTSGDPALAAQRPAESIAREAQDISAVCIPCDSSTMRNQSAARDFTAA